MIVGVLKRLLIMSAPKIGVIVLLLKGSVLEAYIQP